MKLISSPAKAWEEISMEEDRRKVYMAFVYPMIGLCGLSVFIGSLLTNGWGGPQSFQIAMTNCCVVAVALFGGYFLAAYAINEMGTRMLVCIVIYHWRNSLQDMRLLYHSCSRL